MKAPLLPTAQDEETVKVVDAVEKKSLAGMFGSMVTTNLKNKSEEEAKMEAKIEEYVGIHSKRLISEFGFFARKAHEWRSAYSNQILLCHDHRILRTYFKRARRGIIKFNSEMETTLKEDLSEYYEGID